ncbi:MAG: peptidoglycan editing factor PgeF [Methylophilus sp.]|nr:peptidoglycan editing factor PgeF [Methylophilus sp.]
MIASSALFSTFIQPDWPAPANVKALQTTRMGGVSAAPYDSFNVGEHVKDNPLHVARNRQLLNDYVPSEPVWLNQVHGTRVIDAALSGCVESADAAFTQTKRVVCVTMTADCLPVLLCDTQGTIVAAVHAGWRSLCDGVIEQTVASMLAKDQTLQPQQLMAWLGPAIGPQAFEVGGEVMAQFVAKDSDARTAFVAYGDKWLGDLTTIATQRLNKLGIQAVFGIDECTYQMTEKYFSFRRDGDTGRMATLIWLSA